MSGRPTGVTFRYPLESLAWNLPDRSLLTNLADFAPTILAVDDHLANLVAVEATLAPLNYRLVTMRSGHDALAWLQENEAMLILMDVQMPVLDGYETTRRVREQERARDIPIMFLTAVFDHVEHSRRGYALGAVDYVVKPFDPHVLRAKVQALVGLYLRGQRTERQRSEEAERIKDIFLGAVGHDLRNPLNAVRLAAQLLVRGEDCGNREHRRNAERINRAAVRMDRIIEDILDLTRGQFAGGIPLNRQRTDLVDVSRSVIDELRTSHPRHAVHFDMSGEIHGQWDPDRLGRVVSNLLGNAVQHGGGGAIHIRIRDEGEQVILEVHNEGLPIDEAMLPKLFEPFRRGDTSRNGLGLGLYIVREIVRAHTGRVDVRSTSTEGTTFTVVLPKGDPTTAPEHGKE